MKITNEHLEFGFIIHNEKQISVEIDGQIKLLVVDNTETFAQTLILKNEAEVI